MAATDSASRQKPVVFFSHSTRDAGQLCRLKELICGRTSGVVDVFLSSDGESIRFGANWNHRVEEAMAKCRLMFVFISPHSLSSRWIYFESGWACARGIHVVPVAMPGVNLGELGAPLSLLQGFNLHSEDGLGNLVVTFNQEFESSFQTGFSESEFSTLEFTPSFARATFGDLTPLIKDVAIRFEHDKFSGETPAPLRMALNAAGIAFREESGFLLCNGFRAILWGQNLRFLEISADPWSIDSTFGVCKDLLLSIDPIAMRSCTVATVFNRAVAVVPDDYRICSRLSEFGPEIGGITGVRVNGFVVTAKNLESRPGSNRFTTNPRPAARHHGCEITIRSSGEREPSLADLAEMVGLFFERGLILVDDSELRSAS